MHWTVASLAATLPRKEVRTVGVLALLCLGCLAALRGDREPHGNWPAYGNDAGGGRYAPLSHQMG
jgi:hypothetical protein